MIITQIVHESNEDRRITFISATDPTGDDIEFQITAVGERSDDDSWSAGEWTAAGWTAANKRAQAITPRIGAGATLATIAPGTPMVLWVRWRDGVIEVAANVTVN